MTPSPGEVAALIHSAADQILISVSEIQPFDTRRGLIEGVLRAAFRRLQAQNKPAGDGECEPEITMRAIAEFPVTDRNNLDAINMQQMAKRGLTHIRRIAASKPSNLSDQQLQSKPVGEWVTSSEMSYTPMVERVALATCSSEPCVCRHKAGFEGMPCLVRGKSALQALIEPTDVMYAAVSNSGIMWKDNNSTGIWKAMITAALEGK